MSLNGSCAVQQARALHSELGIELCVLAIANSRTMLLDKQSVDLSTWQADLAARVLLSGGLGSASCMCPVLNAWSTRAHAPELYAETCAA